MKITIHQLPEGIHKIEQIVEAKKLNFFEKEHYLSDILLKITLNKFGNNIKTHVYIETDAIFECDRCLCEFKKHFKDDFEMLFYFGEKKLETNEDDVIIIEPDEKEIDFSERICESLVLGVPIKKLCSENCKGICAHCGADLNNEKCKCPDTPVDPRWDNLRKLLK